MDKIRHKGFHKHTPIDDIDHQIYTISKTNTIFESFNNETLNLVHQYAKNFPISTFTKRDREYTSTISTTIFN